MRPKDMLEDEYRVAVRDTRDTRGTRGTRDTRGRLEFWFIKHGR